MSPETKTSDFRFTVWNDKQDKPFAVVLTGELNGKSIKIDIFKRSIHIYVDGVARKRIMGKNAQFIEDCAKGNVNRDVITYFLKSAQEAGLI